MFWSRDVLSKSSVFSWERILFFKSACVNVVMQIQVQIGDTRKVFFVNPPGSVEVLKYTTFLREIPKTRFMGFGLLYENDKGEYVLFTLARFACLLHICVKTSRFHYSIWATPK